MALPHSLSGVEHWMRDKEDYADHLMEVIMTPGTFSGMMFNILLIAALPAIGEELDIQGHIPEDISVSFQIRSSGSMDHCNNLQCDAFSVLWIFSTAFTWV